MEQNSKQYETHTLKSFLEKYHVVIPMVQRDYAQGRTTDDVNRIRERFLDAIKSCLETTDDECTVMKLDFIYGEKELIWSDKEANKLVRINVTPLDGQQRLTTLFLLYWFASKQSNTNGEDQFLCNFTYDIRPSSRDFCTHLMKYTPDWTISFQSQIKDQNWFMGEWKNDPTIISMLVMLDAIKEKFGNITNLWQLLTSDTKRIIFYFLPLSENGLSDELYIKMNSRGKKLTAFEHFKAEYEDLYERDSQEVRIINHKFDVEWIDVFFPYRNKEDIVDNEFMRYFFYVSHILSYKQNIPKTNDEFELIKLLYKDSPLNRKYLEAAFDCWYDVLKEYKSIDSFFETFLSYSSYETNKVATFKNPQENHGCQNIFYSCIKRYQVNSNFSYGDFLFLYGIITYLINKDKVPKETFIKRLRMLRNLIWNSDSGEIRSDADYMQSLLAEVESLMIDGTIDKSLPHRFNGIQENEENKKETIALENDLLLEKLYKYEDHPLIYGFASGLGYDHLDLVDTFISLFSDSPDFLKIHRAMLSIGDYRQKDSIRYYMGNANRSTWSRLLHKSKTRDCFEEKTMPILRTLLLRLLNGESLDGIINNYLLKKEEDKKYDWRYYFVKYPEMLRGAEGELTWESNSYLCTTLNKHQFNGQHWNPFLNVIFIKLDKEFNHNLVLGNYGENLTILNPVSSLEATATGFVYYHQEDYEKWDVEQEVTINDEHEIMIDKQDRIELAIEKLRDLVQKENAVL